MVSMSAVVDTHPLGAWRHSIAGSVARGDPAAMRRRVVRAMSGEDQPVHLRSASYCDEENVLAVPITLDFNGLPLISVYIGTPPQVLSMALDTASCDMVVSGSDCATCGSHLGKYSADASETSRELDECSSIAYGTQLDRGCWVSERVGFAGRCVSDCSDLRASVGGGAVGGGAVGAGYDAAPNGGGAVLDLVVFDNVKILVSDSREGSPYNNTGMPRSDYSILGMCHAANEGGRIPTMRQILTRRGGGKPGIYFTLVIGRVHKWFLLGKFRDPCAILHTLEPVPHDEFYVVRTTGFYVGETVLKLAPSNLIVDSGSNFLFLPRPVFAEFQTVLAKDGRKGEALRFTFRSFTLNIPYDVYFQKGAMLVYPYESDSIIVGSMLLQNHVIVFDIERRRVEIGVLGREY